MKVCILQILMKNKFKQAEPHCDPKEKLDKEIKEKGKSYWFFSLWLIFAFFNFGVCWRSFYQNRIPIQLYSRATNLYESLNPFCILNAPISIHPKKL